MGPQKTQCHDYGKENITLTIWKYWSVRSLQKRYVSQSDVKKQNKKNFNTNIATQHLCFPHINSEMDFQQISPLEGVFMWMCTKSYLYQNIHIDVDKASNCFAFFRIWKNFGLYKIRMTFLVKGLVLI